MPVEKKIAPSPSRQRIWVFLQDERAVGKTAAINRLALRDMDLRVFTIDQALPLVIDDATAWLPQHIRADLVLDHLKHPDLTHALAELCRKDGVPMIASGKKGPLKGVYTPLTCCALTEQEDLGAYGRKFGVPVFELHIDQGRVRAVDVRRGAPCGATWEAARKIIGLTVEEACTRIGLETQYFCIADPAGWDPISGKSPVHIAGELHKAAFLAALKKTR
jgi:hypothetical protein